MLDVGTVSFETVLGFHPLSHLLILVFVFLSILDEALNFFFRESTLVVSDGDSGIGVGSLVSCLNIHNSVCVNLEGDFDLRNSSGSRGNTVEVELA